MLKNYMEDIVNRLLPKVIYEQNKQNNICSCDSCLLDIKAIALNNLEPRYTVSDKGQVFVKIDKSSLQSETDVIKEITKAIEIVSNNPRH